MINNSSVNRCLKSDFKMFERIDENSCILRWGREDEKERVFNIDEETGALVYTGDLVDSDRCSYESGVYKGVLTKSSLDKVFSKSQRLPKMRELRVFGELIGMKEEDMLSWMKVYLIQAITKYDKSKNVEDLTINGVHIWLDHNLRLKVRENLESCDKEGITETVLRIDGMEFPITVEIGWNMYYSLLSYARDTWNMTEIHKISVQKIETTEGMIDYEDNYPSAYPPKLSY